MSNRKRIAAIVTEYFAGSHADVAVMKFLKGFPTNDSRFAPGVDLVSKYIDQFTESDVGRVIADEHDVPNYSSIVKAMTLDREKLAVDGVLLIGEHGDYVWNEKEQQLFPRKHLMEQICGLIATSGGVISVFSDKHLYYNWYDAKWMYGCAAELNVPFMAVFSLPLVWRNPWREHDRETDIQEAIAIDFPGLDIYGFHTLEVLQCMVERRTGGESGVAAVTCLEGDLVWQAADDGLWSRELAEAACAAIENKPDGRMETHCSDPVVMLIEYRDGFRGVALMLEGYVRDLSYAARTGDGIVATEFYAQGHGDILEGPFAHFAYLSLNVEEMFLTGTPSYPVERTLLTTGVLEAALTSRFEGHCRLETPWLNVPYQSYESLPWRPTGPRPGGACLDPWP